MPRFSLVRSATDSTPTAPRNDPRPATARATEQGRPAGRFGHRRFIATVLALSMAISSGVTARPAQANEDVAKFIAGAALLGILGAAINDAKDRDTTVTRGSHGWPHGGTPQGGHHGGDKPRGGYHGNGGNLHVTGPRPLPPRISRYDLPAGCLSTLREHGENRRVLGLNCLQRNYSYVDSLPATCFDRISNKHQTRRGFVPGCLSRHGYRMVNR